MPNGSTGLTLHSCVTYQSHSGDRPESGTIVLQATDVSFQSLPRLHLHGTIKALPALRAPVHEIR